MKTVQVPQDAVVMVSGKGTVEVHKLTVKHATCEKIVLTITTVTTDGVFRTHAEEFVIQTTSTKMQMVHVILRNPMMQYVIPIINVDRVLVVT
tara:strand:+ start:738 stop:1016 length:279 start_codon:yes stop_codon:yes gene_type:complete